MSTETLAEVAGEDNADTGAEAQGADSQPGGDAAPADADSPEGGTGDEDGGSDESAARIMELEASLETSKAEAETLRKTFGDEGVMKCAKRSGCLPDVMTAEEIKTVDKAETLAAQVRRLEAMADDFPEGYEDQETGKTVTNAAIKGWLRKTRADLDEVRDAAKEIRKRTSDELRGLIALGKAAKAAKWTPDGDSKRRVAPAAKGGKPPAPPSAAPRRPSTQPPKKPGLPAWNDIKDTRSALAKLGELPVA